jgi:hypothetical protein
MASQDLLDAIRDDRSKGIPDDKIREMMLKKGWTPEDVNGAFAVSKIPEIPSSVLSRPSAFTQTSSRAHKSSLVGEIVFTFVMVVLVVTTGGILYLNKVPVSVSSISQFLSNPFQTAPLVSKVSPSSITWNTYEASSTKALPTFTFGYPASLGGPSNLPHASSVLGLTFANKNAFKVYFSLATPASNQTFQQWVTENYGYVADSPHTSVISNDQSRGGYVVINGRLSLAVENYVSQPGNSLYLLQLKNRQVLIVALLGSTLFPAGQTANEKDMRDAFVKSITFTNAAY